MGRGRRKKRQADARSGWPTFFSNQVIYDYYFDRLKELAINAVKWEGLPPEIDERFLELTLFDQGFCIFYRDAIADKFVALPGEIGGTYDIYGNPVWRHAIAANGYNYNADISDSVIIYNNYLRTPSVNISEIYAQKLYELDRTADVNVKAQKFPVLIKATENQRLTALEFYQQYAGNEPFIFASKSIDPEMIEVLKTDAPFVADKLQMLKESVWREALVALGIDSQYTKVSNTVALEAATNFGAIQSARVVRLNARRQAAEKINAMFGLNINPVYRYMSISKPTGGDDFEINDPFMSQGGDEF